MNSGPRPSFTGSPPGIRGTVPGRPGTGGAKSADQARIPLPAPLRGQGGLDQSGPAALVPGQLHLVENYWEAAGVMAAMQAGIDPKAVRRPLERAIVEKPTGATPGIAEILTAPLRPF